MYYYLIFGSVYILLAIIAGVCGRKRRIGFWGFLFASIIFTPIISLLFIYFATPKNILKIKIPQNKEVYSV
jgi:hypothetical protein